MTMIRLVHGVTFRFVKQSIDSLKPMMRHNLVTPRKASNLEIDPRLLKCTVCGSDRIVWDKFRINEWDATESTLLLSWVVSVDDVFTADLYYHTICIRRYIRKYEQNVDQQSSTKIPADDSNSTAVIKHVLFLRALDHIDLFCKMAMDLPCQTLRVFVSFTWQARFHYFKSRRQKVSCRPWHEFDSVFVPYYSSIFSCQDRNIDVVWQVGGGGPK
jgi:hypothetical protein